MELYIASDKHGWVMKNEIVRHLKENNKTYIVNDLCQDHENIVDSVSYAFFLAQVVLDDPRNVAIFITKTGNEVSIVMNRRKHIRACLCVNKIMAETAKKDLNSNILVLASDVIETSPSEIVDVWLNTPYNENNFDNLRKNLFMDS